MTNHTIQCRLVAPPETRRHLWQLMTERNTPLVNELLKQVSEHPEFENWRRQGKMPASVIDQLCKSLKVDPRFNGQPSRFYVSAIRLATYIYKSWLAIQKKLQHRLDRTLRWLDKLKRDEELTWLTDKSQATKR